MRNENSIAIYLNGTSKPGLESIDLLKKYADAYPYAESFSLLYLLSLKRNNPIEFEQQLPYHAFRVNNRERLYELVMQEDNTPDVLPKEESDLLTSDSITFNNTIESAQEQLGERDKITIEPSTEPEIEPEAVNPISTSNEDSLSQDMLQHMISASYQLPDLNQDEIEEMEKRNTAIKEQKVETPKAAFEKEDNEKPLSFISWLHANQNYEWDNVEPLKLSEKHSEPALFGNVERPKKDFFSPAKKAKDSLSESELPVSETLAKIYVLQGNYPKAISAYEQLILKIPEKKTFFANLIKDLKKQLNS